MIALHGLTTDDHRRAAVLLKHFGDGNDAGVTAIVDEIDADDRGGQLLFALLVLFGHLLPELRTSRGQELLRRHVAARAAGHTLDTEEP
ncbi:hypothetical protein AAFP35_24015 [Gordonia sp. CPCC 206044]|uniref:hypothetical protein n=1 Tax=Gordonia sp. CPCC 206044 TaxID=3140793 RepID=UPI003AF3BF18